MLLLCWRAEGEGEDRGSNSWLAFRRIRSGWYALFVLWEFRYWPLMTKKDHSGFRKGPLERSRWLRQVGASLLIYFCWCSVGWCGDDVGDDDGGLLAWFMFIRAVIQLVALCGIAVVLSLMWWRLGQLGKIFRKVGNRQTGHDNDNR
jgi:hypothetical protein